MVEFEIVEEIGIVGRIEGMNAQVTLPKKVPVTGVH
jgi:hypothetical protein